ncbi:MAG: hypothetical protein KJP14_11745, partial [Eudoraea sp.]|nr:hypothetical protein [Eudoraea sp.]
MKVITLFLVGVLLILPLQENEAQRRKQKSPEVSYDETLYEGISWRQLGPFRGGRAGTVSGVLNNPNLYYMGTAGGGV